MKDTVASLFRVKSLWWILFSVLLVSSCMNNGDNVAPSNQQSTGQIQLLLTDDPWILDNINSVTITIDKIELRKMDSTEMDEHSGEDSSEMDDHSGMGEDEHSGGDNDKEDSSSFVTVLSEPVDINLMDLRNGITTVLADTSIEAGTYNMIRLYISEAKVELKDSTTIDVKVPGGSESGLKIFIPSGFTVDGGLSSELLLDFNLERSLVFEGSWDNPVKIILKPVIRAVDNSYCGKIMGHVTDTSMAAIQGAYVWLKSDSVVSSTTSEESGFYQMIGIPEGTYTLYAAMQGYDTTEVNDINISGREHTKIDLELTPSE